MKTSILKTCGTAGLNRLLTLTATVTLLLLSVSARAEVVGIGDPAASTGTASFDLTARPGYVSLADGGSIYSWGYSESSNTVMQLPGPTLKVKQGDTVTITLINALPVAAGNTSIVFPGQDVTATGGVAGALATEAAPGGTVTYTFTATKPGTYQYHSGTQTDLQVEMGLFGALIVYPDPALAATPFTCTTGQPAYDNASTCYDIEYLYVLSEIDINTHEAAEQQAGGAGPIVLPPGTYVSEYWLMNGRVGPDTMTANSVPGEGILPSQPYGSLTRMVPGQRLLMRVVGAGREMHPFHHHGNHARMIAVDGELLVNSAGHLSGPLVFTIPAIPGQTADGIFEWTGKELGWDMYGHTAADNVECIPDARGYYTHDSTGAALNPATTPNYMEWCADHNAPIPVTLPDLTNLAFGGFYSGSPYLGYLGSLPPGEGGLNPNAGFAFMWHSHTERELTNNDVFPGGMMTMLIVEPPSERVNIK